MAAGQGFKTFTTGEVLTAGDVNGYLMQGINVFTNATARDAAITAPAEGQFAFTKDNNSLWYYDGAAWVASGATGDIEGVTAGVGISGGGTSGTVTVTNSMATAIDAKGDLVPGTGADTFARLAVGANDTVLTADSSTATGLKWAAAAASGSTNVAGKNGVLNSQFNVWQRGTTVASGNSYGADRWQQARQASVSGLTVSRQATGDTTNLPFIQYCARVQRDSGNTSTNGVYFGQPFETLNSLQYAGKTVTMSFYARKGANYSPTSSNLNVFLETGTGTDQNAIAGSYTGSAKPINQTITLTTTWQRFSYSATLGSTVTEVMPWFEMIPTGTAGAADYYEITGVQVEIAGSASAYSPNTSTYQAELAACQRYFLKYGGNQINETFPGMLLSYSTTQGEGPIALKSTMRTTPTIAFSTLKVSDVASYNLAVTNLTITSGNSSGDAAYLVFTVASGATSGKTNVLRTDGSTAGFLTFSAEL